MLSFPVRARRGALAAVLVASALHANAQQTAASGSLEEIVVTAQKREQNSQDIGISLSAVSGADLSSLGAVTNSGSYITRDNVSGYAKLETRGLTGKYTQDLGDKHYGVMGFDNTSINGLAQIYPGMPRWFKVHANYKF
jgi:outer membrane receptor protein involved in Fe transport